ncbi:MAG: GNAT family N-acetyltransferase [Nitrososphaerota archaeon]|nr:GNAT family N-acetyltransferase [Nitrososphaerota archaeon]
MVAIPAHEVVRLDENDAEEVHGMLKVTWWDTYKGLLPDSVISEVEKTWHSVDTLRRQMKNKSVLFAGYKEDGKILGLARAAMADTETMRLYQLYVLPSQQGRGIGSALMAYAKNSFPNVKRVALSVAKVNDKAISFYRRRGFVFLKESSLKLGGFEIRELEGTWSPDSR